MDEPNQALKSAGIIPKHILTLSWNIATEPKLYRELVPNPYSRVALQIISERFPDASIADIIRAVVLAEPEGKYDRNFRQLPKAQQEEELSKQKDISDKINKQLVQYCNEHAKEFSRLPKEFIYDHLAIVVFETTDLKQVEQRYAQNQRRDFRLSIVNFIEDTQRPKSYEKPALRRWPLLLVVGFTALFLILFFSLEQRQARSTISHLEAKKQVLGIEAQKISQGFPVRLIIPAINVNASIQQLGVTQSGEMDVPNNTVDVGWFKLGSRPGEKGSAVIAGHLNGKNGEAGVFTNLYKLKQGDKLYIEDDKGVSITFVVRENRAYDSGYAEDVFSSSDSAHLNLITCNGVWDKNKKSYTKRLVVFADIL